MRQEAGRVVLVAVRFANEKVEIRFVLKNKNTILGAHCDSRRVASGRWRSPLEKSHGKNPEVYIAIQSPTT